MKSFKAILNELRNPGAIKQFKDEVKGVDKVDNRVNWHGTLPTLMAKFGFRQVGAGKYGTVFVSDKYDYAIKIFMRDTAYLTFLQWALKNQHNPYIPKFRGKVVKISPTIYAVRIEKLVDGGSRLESELNELLRDYEDVLDNYYDDSTYTLKISDPNIRSICEFLLKHRKLVDIHLGNIMSRPNGQPVVVDPCYNWYKGGNFQIDPDDISGFKDLF